MRIGNLPPEGARLELGKWYFGIEVLVRPPYLVHVFKPCVMVVMLKVLDYGRPGRVDDPGRKERGFWRRYVCPFGITLEITR